MATIDQWTAEDNEAEYARKIIAACHRATPFDQAAALADLTGSAPEPIAEEIQPEPIADDAAPVSDCMAAIIEAASEPEPVADDVAIAHAEFDAAGAADTASHPLESAAQHVAKRRAQLAEAKPAEAGFRAELVRYAERDHAELAAAFAVFDSIGDGAELSTADGKRHCILVPDASEPGRYRYSMFDARGFFSHSAHNTAAEAVADAARAGFTVAAPGILDRLATTQEWEHGSAVAAVMQQHNSGRISWADACAEFEHLAAVYAKPAEPAPDLAPIAAEPEPDTAPDAHRADIEAASIADMRHCAESARILAEMVDTCAASRPDPRAASVRMLRREADRIRAVAAASLPRIARNHRIVAEMLQGLAGSRDDAPAEIKPAAAHPGRCSARRPGVAVRIKPAATAASRAPGRLAAGIIRAAGFRPHRAAIAPHRAGRLAAASRGAVRSIGCAGRPGRGAPPAAGCAILQAPGPAAGGAAGPGPPSGATPRPADSQTPYSRRFPHTGDSP
jgi:hypothetical protein